MKTYLMLALPFFANRLSAQLILEKSANHFAISDLAKLQFVDNPLINTTEVAYEIPPREKKIEIPNPKIHFWQLNWDNDYWIPTQKTDRYYTNGIFLQCFFNKNGFNKPFWQFLFPKIAVQADNYYGTQLQMEMYTPDSIWTQQPQDRPYCGIATIGMTCISKQSQTGIRLTTEYRIGSIGPNAQQAALQNKWHQLLQKPIPLGWNQQIPNAMVFNVHGLYEHPLNYFSNKIEIMGLADINLGTLSMNAGAGLQVKAGHFHRAKEDGINLLDVRKRQKYIYFQSLVRYVVTDATLQGGVSLNDAERKPYIQIDNLTRVVAHTSICCHWDNGNWGFEYRFQTKTPEWKGGKTIFWGSFKLQKGF